MRRLSRRQFLALTAAAAAAPAAGSPTRALSARPLTGDWSQSRAYSLALRTGSTVPAVAAQSQLQLPRRRNPRPPVDWAAAGRLLRRSDLARHVIFEYYPWYATAPWRHWNQWD